MLWVTMSAPKFAGSEKVRVVPNATEQLMRTHLEFESKAFPPELFDSEDIDPTGFGRELAVWLTARFGELGYPAEEPILEDWGWCIPLSNEQFRLWLGCSAYGDGWLVFIGPSKPYVCRWFRKLDTQPAVARVADSLEQLLKTTGTISMRWWSDRESERK
jgi:hypothetical protein